MILGKSEVLEKIILEILFCTKSLRMALIFLSKFFFYDSPIWTTFSNQITFQSSPTSKSIHTFFHSKISTLYFYFSNFYLPLKV